MATSETVWQVSKCDSQIAQPSLSGHPYPHDWTNNQAESVVAWNATASDCMSCTPRRLCSFSPSAIKVQYPEMAAELVLPNPNHPKARYGIRMRNHVRNTDSFTRTGRAPCTPSRIRWSVCNHPVAVATTSPPALSPFPIRPYRPMRSKPMSVLLGDGI